jgi:hypothetical protein
MIIDAVDISGLGDNAEEAFVAFEERLRAGLEKAQIEDRRRNEDMNGNYTGSYAPERYYVSSILAFLDEYDLDLKVEDITEVGDPIFLTHFNKFFNTINYARTRFMLRKSRIETGAAGTPILIAPNFKDEIHKNLDTIRKIVNQNVQNENKKDAIFKKIAALQSEIDRNRTTVDAVFSRAIDLSKVLGDVSENLEPAVQKFERVMAALKDGSERIPFLPKKERTKLLPPQEEMKVEDLNDNIPF